MDHYTTPRLKCEGKYNKPENDMNKYPVDRKQTFRLRCRKAPTFPPQELAHVLASQRSTSRGFLSEGTSHPSQSNAVSRGWFCLQTSVPTTTSEGRPHKTRKLHLPLQKGALEACRKAGEWAHGLYHNVECFLKCNDLDFPGSLVSENSVLPIQGAQVRSLVGELRCLHGAANK